MTAPPTRPPCQQVLGRIARLRLLTAAIAHRHHRRRLHHRRSVACSRPCRKLCHAASAVLTEPRCGRHAPPLGRHALHARASSASRGLAASTIAVAASARASTALAPSSTARHHGLASPPRLAAPAFAAAAAACRLARSPPATAAARVALATPPPRQSGVIHRINARRIGRSAPDPSSHACSPCSAPAITRRRAPWVTPPPSAGVRFSDSARGEEERGEVAAA